MMPRSKKGTDIKGWLATVLVIGVAIAVLLFLLSKYPAAIESIFRGQLH
jgi:hypothetical protein